MNAISCNGQRIVLPVVPQFVGNTALVVASRPAFNNNASSFPPVPVAGPCLAASLSILRMTAAIGHPGGGRVLRDIVTM